MSGLGASLIRLRESRGWSLNQAAATTGIARSTLRDWECNRSRPTPKRLKQLLQAYEVDDHVASELILRVDPGRIHHDAYPTDLGPPIAVGILLSTIRKCQAITQGALAARLDVSQATVARWETGALCPGPERIREIAFALGLPPYMERLLTNAIEADPSPEEETDESLTAKIHGSMSAGSHGIFQLLALERLIWERARKSSAGTEMLCLVQSYRAQWLYLNGRHQEAHHVARSCLVRAATPRAKLNASIAMGTLASLSRQSRANPYEMVRELADWIPSVPNSGEKAWLLWVLGLHCARLRRPDAMDLTHRSLELRLRFPGPVKEIVRSYEGARAEIWLASGKAEEALASYSEAPSNARALLDYIRAHHALGVPAVEDDVQKMSGLFCLEPSLNWYDTKRHHRVIRRQRLLTAAAGKP